MNLQDVTSSRQIMRLTIFASQHLSEGTGHRLAGWLSGVVSRMKPAVYRIVLANLGQVMGPGVERGTLEQTARQVFCTMIRGYWDLFRALRLPHEELLAQIDVPEEVQSQIERSARREGGSVLVIPHLGNFDLGGQAIGALVPEIQVLTLPNPAPGFQLVNELRRRSGVAVTPLSSAALRQALDLLRRGGVVAVAGDRPVSNLDEPVPFFGRPARVPSAHVRLALKTNATVMVGCCFLSPETDRYTVHVEPPLEMVRGGDRQEEVRLNMRRVLDVLEEVIRRWVGQWQMFVPVWPELLACPAQGAPALGDRRHRDT